MKTVRLTDVIMQSGVPQMHLAWTAPDKDPALQQALKQDRLMTVHQQTRGSKKDFAVVGLEPGHDRQFLVFPKSLRRFKEARIIAIQYDLIAPSVSLGPAPKPSKRPASRATAVKPAAAAPKPARPEPRPDNLLAFDAGARPAEARQQATPKKPGNRPSPAAQPRRFKDPVLNEVRRALDDLRAGMTRSVERRLEALLARGETEPSSNR